MIVDSYFRGYDSHGRIDFDASTEYAVDPNSRENVEGVLDVDRLGMFEFPPFVEKRVI